MKRLLFVSIILITVVVSVLAQKIDYTTYDVIAKTQNVTIIVKNNDYRMVIGSLKKPKTSFLLGNSAEQVKQYIDKLTETIERDQHIREKRMILFCGVPLSFSARGTGKNVRYCFQRIDNSLKFELKVADVKAITQCIETL